ncbi:MAG: UPF0223 family protein [Enterococcus lacertideformus]|uniref:UPF0223 family protein n=1 Tax=Enterococcus lacertideformus TaxID=2771493 RepID=A0A931AVJ9_9ENTE|nr:UPF0223 family protein [Enterococcus lacertideformus]
MKEYQYPLDLDWTINEMVTVMDMWETLEMAYEKGIDNVKFLKTYQRFKTVVPSIGEEKKLSKSFEQISGYSLYQAVQEAKKNNKKILKMEE